METSRSVSSVHVRVIEDVVANIRNEFAASGVDEEVLSALQAIWAEKMLQCCAITGMVRRPVPPPAAAVHDLNVPYEGPYETPTAEMLFPPANTNANASESLLTRASLGSDITATVFTKEQRSNTLLVQQDGVNDEYDHFYHYEGVSSEGHHDPAHYVKNETVYGDEPPLNEDDDDEDDLEDEQGNAEPNTHLVLAQFDKVTRTKSKWKCTLKSGIMHYNNRDVLFNTATGEFEF